MSQCERHGRDRLARSGPLAASRPINGPHPQGRKGPQWATTVGTAGKTPNHTDTHTQDKENERTTQKPAKSKQEEKKKHKNNKQKKRTEERKQY